MSYVFRLRFYYLSVHRCLYVHSTSFLWNECITSFTDSLVFTLKLYTLPILFTLKHFTNLPHIILGGIPIKFVSDHKHLGLTLSYKGQWHKHIENIVVSASKVIGIMRKLKYTFHRVALNQIYILYILPILEYSGVIWDNDTMQDTSTFPVSILRKSISGHHRPVRVADGPMTARCRFT